MAVDDLCDASVAIVGAGPSGLVLASLLGAAGVTTVLLEQNVSTTDEPRAVSIDDETLRVLHRAQLADLVEPVLLPGTGTKYVGANGRRLFYARGAEPPPFGHPVKSPFHQPELERRLRDGLGRFSDVSVRFGTTVTEVRDTGDGVNVEAVDRRGEPLQVRARYLVGCDGGRSVVRRQIGVSMQGDSFDDQWLVVDTVGDDHDERYGLHVGDPRRPHVVIPGLDGQCRYEFRLRAGEADGDSVPFELIERLVATYRTITPNDVVRQTVYRFHALVANAWKVGNCFLAGDAAHMMPPFAGQGLNSGIRDVDNLAWKLAAVLHGGAPAALLDTYEPERRPHAEAMVLLSRRLGRIVMTPNPVVAGARDAAIRVGSIIPGFRRWLSEMRFRPRPAYTAGAVQRDRASHQLVGRMFPQPPVLGVNGRAAVLDDLLGSGLALVLIDPPGQIPHPDAEKLAVRADAQLVVLVLGDRLARPGSHAAAAVLDERSALELQTLRGHAVLVRPDRFVAAVSAGDDVDALDAWLDRWWSMPSLSTQPLPTIGESP